MGKEFNNNGFDYVDLELPSRTLWATCNVGASKPSDSGLYFQWGDIKGYTKEQVGKENKFEYDFSNYKFSIDGSNANFSKYTTPMAMLELEDDAAHVHMGGDWHIPSPMQYQELIDNTKREWIKYAGVKGMAFTSKNDSSKFIFIPAVGEVEDGSCYCVEQNGYIWSSTMSAYDFIYGKYFNFCLEDIYVGIGLRYYGLPVRGVIDKKQDDSKFKKENTTMADKINSLKAYDDEIKSLQEKNRCYKEEKECLPHG